MEEETLGRGPKSGGKEELGKKEWIYSISLELKRGEEGGFFVCSGMKERGGGLYSSGGENMNGRPFNEGWKRIMNLDLILAFKEIWCIKYEDWWE